MTRIDLLANKFQDGFKSHIREEKRGEFKSRFIKSFEQVVDIFPPNEDSLSLLILQLAGAVHLNSLKHHTVRRGDVDQMLRSLKKIEKQVKKAISADRNYILYSTGNLSRLSRTVPKDIEALTQLYKQMERAKKSKMEISARLKVAKVVFHEMKMLLESKRMAGKLDRLQLKEPNPKMFEVRIEKDAYKVTAIKLAAMFLWTIGNNKMTTDKFHDWLKSKEADQGKGKCEMGTL